MEVDFNAVRANTQMLQAYILFGLLPVRTNSLFPQRLRLHHIIDMNEGDEKMAVAASQGVADLTASMKELFKSSKFADLKLVCGTKEWNVHKAIVCGQSEFFMRACDGGSREAKENTIVLDQDEDLGALSAMMHYLYNFDYTAEDWVHEYEPMLLHVRVYAVADKYLINPLKDLAASKFSDLAKEEWGTLAFAEAVEEAYCSGPPIDSAIRRVAVTIIQQNVSELFSAPSTYARFNEVMRHVPNVATDVAEAVFAALAGGLKGWYKCPQCKADFGFTIRENRSFSCPMRCSTASPDFWACHKISFSEMAKAD